VVAETHDEAVAKLAEYRRYVSPAGALALFGGWTGVDLAELDPGEPLTYVETDANRSALASFTTAAPERAWTVGELADEIGIGGRGPVLVGSPTEVADELERWVTEADVDGFNLAYVTTPGTFVDFAKFVVPELRRRGRVPERPLRSTLRQRLGTGGPLLPDDHPGAAYRR
jgi:alkanesulfonate monooxygenase SsuD/methylene tetrahydromethanopterin reductase-like flavin-dependent oxidoreductase (luciferase family)